MRSRSLSTLVALACVLGTALSSLQALAQEFVPGEVVVGFKAEARPEQVAAMETQLGLSIKSDFPHIRARHYRLPAETKVEEAIPLILRFDFVEYAEPNYLHKRQTLPTDPRFGEQWYLRNTGQIVNGLQGTAGEDINWPAARDLFSGTKEIIVAVVDTGVAFEHPELSGRLWAHPVESALAANGVDDDGNGFVDDRIGWDFYDNDSMPRDEHGHGTLVASLIGAPAGNGEGGVGVSPTARIMALRAGNDFGSLPLTASISAFTYAAKRGARIINFSAGSTFYSSSMLASIQWLATKGVLFVAAAGNGGSDGLGDNNDSTPFYPASYPVANVISVAALDADGDLTSFSNYGASSVHIAAPGANIFGAEIRTSTHYYENFETGGPGWTQAQLSGSLSSLSWGLYADPQGNRWFADSVDAESGLDIPYQANTRSALISPQISLAGVTGAQLSVRLWHRLERGYDFGYVEITDDGRSTWNFLGVVTGSSYGACAGCAGAPGTELRYDLSRYEGKTVQVRFRLVSDSAVQYAGLFVDNVRITKLEPFLYDGTQYQFRSGTSFAAPLVAGAAALVWSQRPDLTMSQVRQIILGSARHDARLAGRVLSGGKLDLYAAVQSAIATPAGLALSAEFVDFGKQTVGQTSAARAITLRNDGTTTLTGLSFNMSDSSSSNAYPIGNDCGALAPGGTCTLSVPFAPQQAGEIEAAVSIQSNAAGSPHVINLLGVGIAAASAGIYSAAGYLPLVDNATKTWLRDGLTYTSIQLPGTVLFNGAAVRQIQDSDDSTIGYYTNDANGIREHGYYTPSTYVPGIGDTSETLTLSPPLKVTDAQFSLGQTVNSLGTAAITWAGNPTFPLSYESTYTAVAFETITVPAGTFKALRADYYLRIFGSVGTDFYVNSTVQGSDWVVDGLGSVKSVWSTNDGSQTESHNEVLTASSLLDTSPNPFSLPPATNVTPGAQVTSSPITVEGINAGVEIRITGGEYSVDGGAWTPNTDRVFNGQSVSVRHTASSSYGTTTQATLTIGGVSAVFEVTTALLVSYPVTVLVAGSGTVTSNPPGINCGSTCTYDYPRGTSVTLTASPAPDYAFAGWTGACTGTEPCTLTVDAARNVSASFTQLTDAAAPTVPQGLTAVAIGPEQIKLRWIAASDNVAVTQYRLYRDGSLAAVLANAASYVDSGLSASTAYSYAVAACDAAGNCSAQSDPLSAATLPPGEYVFTPELELGWNLLGNSLSASIDVAAVFGDQSNPVTGITEHVISVWKWDAVSTRWAFHSPKLSPTEIASYAASRGFEVLGIILPGEGYWVNAASPISMPMQTGSVFSWTSFNFSALPSGWNLIATASNVSPSQFNVQVSPTPIQQGQIPTDNFVSLWAWNTAIGAWYFYAPSLELSGGLAEVKANAGSRDYLHFEDFNRKLGVGDGFWVNRP